jgi:hypothetical protein
MIGGIAAGGAGKHGKHVALKKFAEYHFEPPIHPLVQDNAQSLNSRPQTQLKPAMWRAAHWAFFENGSMAFGPQLRPQ